MEKRENNKTEKTEKKGEALPGDFGKTRKLKRDLMYSYEKESGWVLSLICSKIPQKEIEE
jgi:hypothetical protein